MIEDQFNRLDHDRSGSLSVADVTEKEEDVLGAAQD